MLKNIDRLFEIRHDKKRRLKSVAGLADASRNGGRAHARYCVYGIRKSAKAKDVCRAFGILSCDAQRDYVAATCHCVIVDWRSRYGTGGSRPAEELSPVDSRGRPDVHPV